MILSIEVLTLIALWCGQPTGKLGDTNMIRKTSVNECREQLADCISKASGGTAKTKCVMEIKI